MNRRNVNVTTIMIILGGSLSVSSVAFSSAEVNRDIETYRPPC